MLNPPPWPSFGVRPAGADDDDTYQADLDAADAGMRDQDGRDSAHGHGPAVLDSADDDDLDCDDAGSGFGAPGVVILLDSATSRASISPDAVPSGVASRPDTEPENLVILSENAASRTYVAADNAAAPATAMTSPPASPAAEPAAGPAQVGATSNSVAGQVPDPVAATSASGPPGLIGSADLGPEQAAGAEAAEAARLGARHEQWRSIQSAFVDDPRRSVTAAADLVAQVVGELVASAQERERALRGEWDRDGIDTEDLRNALRHYRASCSASQRCDRRPRPALQGRTRRQPLPCLDLGGASAVT